MTIRTLSGVLVLTILILRLAWADEPAAPPVAKTAVPDASTLKDAQKLVNEVYADDIAKAKKPEEKSALAKKLLQSAIETKNDAPGKYVLLGMAKDLAASAGDAETAFAAIAELEKFQINAFKMKLEALTAISKSVRGPDAKSLADRANTMIEEEVAADRYETAGQLAQLCVSLAKTSKDLDAIKGAAARVQDIRSAEAAYAEVKKALATLADKPKDPEANLAAGKYYCLMKGQWDKGLPMLALGSDAAWKALAQRELAVPADAPEQVALGDEWWDLAAKENGAAQRQVKQHAGEWYGKALPSLTGLAKAKIQKRLAETETTPSGSSNQYPQSLELDLGNKIKMRLVLIPRGKFMMGNPKEDPEREQIAEPPHEVVISKPFYFGIYAVTQEQYQQVMGKNPSQFKGALNPVEMVSWDDAVEFCKTLTKKTGREVRLPTEAEWEYACRAGTTTPFNLGQTLSTDQANYNGKITYGGDEEKGVYRQKTLQVGSFKPNAWGLYDMHGNVFQWCGDWYGEKFYADSPKTDPQGPKDGNWRVLRGGAWSTLRVGCRSAHRYWNVPDFRLSMNGFRVVVVQGSE